MLLFVSCLSLFWPCGATCAFAVANLCKRRRSSAAANFGLLPIRVVFGSISLCTSKTPTSLVVGKVCVCSIVAVVATGGVSEKNFNVNFLYTVCKTAGLSFFELAVSFYFFFFFFFGYPRFYGVTV